MNPFYNLGNPVEWLRAMREIETEDDKTEYELSDPRYIEDFIEEDYDDE